MGRVMKSRPILGAVAAAAALTLFGASCRRPRPAQPVFYRFIDQLRPAGLIESPLRAPATAALGEKAFPVNSRPMPEAGSGDPALGAKRKINLGPAEYDILFAPPRSEYEYAFPLRQAGFLDFWIGIVRDANSNALTGPAAAASEGVDFLIVLEAGGRKKVLFQKRLALPPAGESRMFNFSRQRVDLPSRSGEAAITFITAGSPGAFSFWCNPVFYAPSSGSPNIVLISIDSLRPDHLGAYHYAKPVSPAIDALAGDGVVFDNAYSTSSWTLPAHMSMLTGLICGRHRVYYEGDRLDPGIPTLAEKLRERGYATGAVTGAGFVSSFYGFSKGFDGYGMAQGGLLDAELAGSGGKEAVEWLGRNSDKPFFLFLHTYQVHYPYKSPDPYPERFLGRDSSGKKFVVQRELGASGELFNVFSEAERDNIVGLYDAGIRYTDDALIKPVVDALRGLGVYDRTLIVVASDHGEEFFDHRGWTHTHGVYDELLRIPLILKMPGSKFKGRRLEPIVRITDLMPTILETAGVPFGEASISGRSLTPILKGREKADRVFLAEFGGDAVDSHVPQRVATNEGRRKLILNQPYSKPQIAFFQTRPPQPPPVELYDLGADPGERTNIADRPAETPILRGLILRAQKAAALIPEKTEERSKIDRALKDQLRALGYIR